MSRGWVPWRKDVLRIVAQGGEHMDDVPFGWRIYGGWWLSLRIASMMASFRDEFGENVDFQWRQDGE